VDDVDFFRTLVEHVAGETALDRARVYATGMSNGGFMSHRLGCEASDIIAAIAPVAGVLGNTGGGGSDRFDCNPSRPVPVFHVHGETDRLVPYNGNRLLGFPSVADSIEGWNVRNSIAGAETNMTYSGESAQGSTVCQSKGAGTNFEVTLCTFTGGHVWGSNFGMDVSGRMWEFFSQKSL
jgi:polyhydroxybutyrate depolymerase